MLDLCDLGPEAQVVGWVTSAVQRRLTTPGRLRRRVDGRPRVRYRRLLLHLLADVATGAESPLEVGYLNDVERAHGLPRGARQLSSGTPYVTDVDYRPYALLVELDGRLGHEGNGRFRDMDRDNVAGLDGLFTMRYGAQDLYGRPCAIAAQVARALTQRGWTDLPTRCSRCRSVPDQDWV